MHASRRAATVYLAPTEKNGAIPLQRAVDIRIQNLPDHKPGCGRAARRAFRAAPISASISSIES